MTATLWCVGRNYTKHALEMKAEIPTTPLIFIKPGACASITKKITLPSHSKDVHHELEIALKLGEDLKPTHMALAIDLTARDIQTELKKKGQPWAAAKSFSHSAPQSEWVSYPGDKEFQQLQFQLKINGDLRQKAETSQMIFSSTDLIQHIISLYPVQPGDIILTGTPEGVGPIKHGDILEAQIINTLSWTWEVSQ